MAAKQRTNSDKKGSAIFWYVGMLIIFILVIIAGFAINICILNKQFSKNDQALSKSHEVNNPLKSLQTDSTKIYKIKQEDLNKFNDHIDYLCDKVEGEVKRTQENNQYDIDRINAFLAIGLGFLAIIGGLLPIFVNFFSKEHLEEQLRVVQESTNGVSSSAETAKELADNAKDEAKNANSSVIDIVSKIKKIEEDIEPLKQSAASVNESIKKVPVIDLLLLQNAVAKLTSKDALNFFIGDERTNWIIGYLENLLLAVNNFDHSIHSFIEYTPDNLKSFKNVIMELKVALFLGPIRRVPDGKRFQKKIDEVVLQLSSFEKLGIEDYKAQLKTVSATIAEMKAIVENQTTA